MSWSLERVFLRSLASKLFRPWQTLNPQMLPYFAIQLILLEEPHPIQFGEAVRAVLLDADVDAVLVILAPSVGINGEAVAKAVVEVVRSAPIQCRPKPVIVVCLGGEAVRGALETFNSSGVPTYRSPEPAVRAFMHLVSYGRLKEILYETPKDVRVELASGRASARSLFDNIKPQNEQTVLGKEFSRTLLEAYGIPTAKLLAPPQANRIHGLEFFIGAKRDPTFGPVIVFGLSLGGAGASLIKPSVELPPLTERLARGMIESIDVKNLFNGEEDRSKLDIEILVEALIRVSYLIADFPEIESLEINPVSLSSAGITALDVRMVVNPTRIGEAPYSHLAIRPYPEELQKLMSLKDSTSVLLRSIRPEDEVEWHRMISRCSNQSKLFRFFHTFKDTSHEMAARYCFVDYDREIAIVAEIKEGGSKTLVGVGRLVADVDHTTAEYAVIVCDEYQGRGLGSILTNYCTEIARKWGIKTLVAETSPNNRQMLSLFSRKNFALNRQVSDVVICKKDL